jgi:hypothetical protein
MHIRATAFAVSLSIALFAGAARAQDWKEYDYPDAGFAAQFPGQPTVSEIQYRAGAVAGPAKVYAAHLGSADYSVTVADLSGSPADETAALDAAVKALAGSGQIKLDVRARIDRQFGREVSVQGKDGGQITTAVFYIDKKLYILAGRTEPDGSGLAAHFQQSLQFIGADGRPPRRPEDGGGFGRRRFGPPPGEVAQADDAPGGGGDPGQGGRGRRRPPAQAFADCKGKAEGDAVQHQTPRGDVVPATCVSTPEGLAARPNRPFRGPLNGNAPVGAPPADGPPPQG